MPSDNVIDAAYDPDDFELPVIPQHMSTEHILMAILTVLGRIEQHLRHKE